MQPESPHAWLMDALQTLPNVGITTGDIKYVSSTPSRVRFLLKVRNNGFASSAAGSIRWASLMRESEAAENVLMDIIGGEESPSQNHFQ